MAGRKAFEPSKAQRLLVEMHAAVGTPQLVIADILDINLSTLTKYFRRELDLGEYKANAQVGGALFNKAIKGDTTAMIFWMKTRAGWREARDEQKENSQPITINLVDAVKPE
jgi:hypothetical protein